MELLREHAKEDLVEEGGGGGGWERGTCGRASEGMEVLPSDGFLMCTGVF